MSYFASDGPVRGGILCHDAAGVIGVIESPGDPATIGRAMCLGPDADCAALWKLYVHDIWVAGRWTVVDRKFVLAP